jgi:hypothetical protein
MDALSTVNVNGAGFTVKEACALVPLKLILPGSDASTTTVPAPVKVNLEPEIVAGPEITLKVMGVLEVSVALKRIGSTP